MNRHRSPAQREFDALPLLGRSQPRQHHAPACLIVLAITAIAAAVLHQIWG